MFTTDCNIIEILIGNLAGSLMKEYPWVVHLTSSSNREVDTFWCVSAFIYGRVPMFVVCTRASLVSIRNSHGVLLCKLSSLHRTVATLGQFLVGSK